MFFEWQHIKNYTDYFVSHRSSCKKKKHIINNAQQYKPMIHVKAQIIVRAVVTEN